MVFFVCFLKLGAVGSSVSALRKFAPSTASLETMKKTGKMRFYICVFHIFCTRVNVNAYVCCVCVV